MQIKSLVRFPVDFRRARRLLSLSKSPLASFEERPIVLDLATPQMLFDCGRHFASLAHHANAVGSPLIVRCSNMMLACIARKIHGREMLAEPYANWIPASSPLPRNAFVLSDHRDPKSTQMLIGKDKVDGVATMPYPMHPATLPNASRESLERLRRTENRDGIFFAGNQKPKYGDQRIDSKFGYLSRLAVLRTIRSRFPERIAESIGQSRSDSDIVLTDSRVESIEPKNWLSTLARFRFFVCCPGAAQPTCHNLIEAMSVGTIPLIEYGSRVTPALSDGINAVTFDGERGLVEAIHRIDAMSDEEVGRISRGAAAFYDQHLCGSSFLSCLRDQHDPPRFVCMPFHDHNMFDMRDLSITPAAA